MTAGDSRAPLASSHATQGASTCPQESAACRVAKTSRMFLPHTSAPLAPPQKRNLTFEWWLCHRSSGQGISPVHEHLRCTPLTGKTTHGAIRAHGASEAPRRMGLPRDGSHKGLQLPRLIGTREGPAHIAGSVPDVGAHAAGTPLLVVSQRLQDHGDNWARKREKMVRSRPHGQRVRLQRSRTRGRSTAMAPDE